MARPKQKKNTKQKKTIDIYHKLEDLKYAVTRMLVEISNIQDEIMEIE